jgi:hypothetical protein
MSDLRCSTARWQRLRKPCSPTTVTLPDPGAALHRLPWSATTVHHRVPSSQAPHLFWEPSNLVAACTRCYDGGDARIQADNRRRRTAQLIEQQAQQIDRLLERLAYYEDGGGLARQRAEPRIY